MTRQKPRQQPRQQRLPTTRPPLQWTGVLFAFALNLLLITVADLAVRRSGLDPMYEAIATMLAPVVAGLLAALYVKQRGGIHAVLGGLISIPFLILYTFSGVAAYAVFAGALCGLSGAITELLLRRR